MAENEDKASEKISKDLFQDLPVEARAGMLRAQAYDTQTEKVQRIYSEQQMADLKEEISNKSVELAQLLEEKKSLVQEIDTRIKPVKLAVGQAVKDYRNRYEESEEEVFLIDNQEEGTMDVFDSCGKFLYSRRLRPDERQSRIKAIANG